MEWTENERARTIKSLERALPRKADMYQIWYLLYEEGRYQIWPGTGSGEKLLSDIDAPLLPKESDTPSGSERRTG